MLKKISNLVLYKCLFRIHEYNKPDLSDGKYILCPNHSSDFDGPIFWAGFNQVRIMAKQECFDIPVINTILRSVDVVPVDRKANPVLALKNASEYMMQEENRTFLLFPQGTLSDINNDTLSRIKPGAFFIADHSASPIIPVFIEQPRLFHKVRIVYGMPIVVDKNNPFINQNGKYSYYRELWKEEVLRLQQEAEMLENRQVKKVKLNKKHRINSN